MLLLCQINISKVIFKDNFAIFIIHNTIDTDILISWNNKSYGRFGPIGSVID